MKFIIFGIWLILFLLFLPISYIYSKEWYEVMIPEEDRRKQKIRDIFLSILLSFNMSLLCCIGILILISITILLLDIIFRLF